ncbi:MAG: hypothetical protein KAU17_07085 [Spirochaetales bacterium]|jgi:cytochrome c biogenesis protein CcdA|nr:hypothetical protein [Spirochaetales bacterium]
MNKGTKLFFIILIFLSVCLSVAWADGSALGIDYYYLPGCRSCQEFLENTIPALEEKLIVNITVNRFDILDSENYRECEKRLKASGIGLESFPVIFAGSQVLAGEERIAGGIETALLSLKSGTVQHPEDRMSNSIKLSGFGVIPVFIAGLVDGINPCAFSTIVFLILTLSAAGKKGREILVIGTSFTVTVFVTYFLIGLGLFTIIRQASMYPVVSQWIRSGLTAILVLFAAVSLYDYFLIKRGRGGEMLLKLPESLKKKIHGSIKVYRNTTALTLTSVAVGFLVSIFELSCTGQVYFPAIAYMVQAEGAAAHYFLLGIYNGGFIVPLVVVFVLICMGVNSRRIADFFNRHLSVSKLALSGVFAALAVLSIGG